MKTSSISASICRWTARVIGALLSLLFIVVMVVAIRQVGLLNLLTNPRMRLSLAGQAGAALLIVGLLAGWRWELIGGILSVVGLCVIYPAALAYGKITWVFASLFVPGLLYLASHFLRSYAARHSKILPAAGPNA